jgi:hypothetical protein
VAAWSLSDAKQNPRISGVQWTHSKAEGANYKCALAAFFNADAKDFLFSLQIT